MTPITVKFFICEAIFLFICWRICKAMYRNVPAPRIGYMCKVDFDWELGDACGGNKVFPSIEDLKRNRKCWEECGIVEVVVKQRAVIHKGTI